jgi:hypothetical protein
MPRTRPPYRAARVVRAFPRPHPRVTTSTPLRAAPESVPGLGEGVNMRTAGCSPSQEIVKRVVVEAVDDRAEGGHKARAYARSGKAPSVSRTGDRPRVLWPSSGANVPVAGSAQPSERRRTRAG